MAVETRVSAAAYRRLALDEPGVTWELWNGLLVEKPGMTDAHNWLAVRLAHYLLLQLDWSVFQVRINSGRVERTTASFFIPDVFVLPAALTVPNLGRKDVLESHSEPMPLIVEVWSPSTGGYDVREKLAEYQRRGDQEIWYIHPYDRTLTAWVRQPDGSYRETVHRGGIVRPAALPGVAIDLDALFAA